MKTIQDYLETLFINLPETPEIYQLKIDLLANMEDKYHELVAEGRSDNEAIGTVIAEFGNLDEILAEMEVTVATNFATDELPILSEAEAFTYLAVKKQVGLGIGLGVLLCCLGGAALFWLLSTLHHSLLGQIGLVATMILTITVGVSLFIINGFRNNRYEYLQKDFVLTGSSRQAIEAEKKGYERSFIFCITIGVALCIISIVPLLVAGIVYSHDDQIILLGLAGMAAIAGCGSFFFVYSGNIMLAFNILLQHGKLTQPTKVEKRKSKVDRIFENVYWPLVVIAFFVFGFSGFGWGFGTSWLVFPLAGILESMIKTFFESE